MSASDDVLLALADRIATTTRSDRPALVGVAGSVAVGKSTLASALAAALEARGVRVEVVGTDAFLLPNDVLTAHDLLMRKGFPETYDGEAIDRFTLAVRSGTTPSVPVYDHRTYDRVPGAVRTIPAVDVVMVEGVNALQAPLVDALDLRLYVHAAEEDIRAWFEERFCEFCRLAETDESSFYRLFVDRDDDGRRDVARQVWDAINGPNLRNHIAPSRARADVEVHKARDHALVRLVERR